MFGYIFPKKQELLVKEWLQYKAIYCSLCRTLQKEYGVISKAFLNYDFVFLALIGLSQQGDDPEYFQKRCTTNSFKKQLFLKGDVLSYAAACLVITTYHKLTDNLRDERLPGKITSFSARLAIYSPYKKACLRYPDICLQVQECMTKQLEIEQKKDSCVDFDELSDPSAIALAYIFSKFGTSLEQERILSRLGYMLARYIYIADACDDLVSDIKNKRYNLLKLKYDIFSECDERIPSVIDDTRKELLQARSEIASCYNLLNIRRLKPILDNIIFLALVDIAKAVGIKRAKQTLGDIE